LGQHTLPELVILVGLTIFPIATLLEGTMPEKKLEELRTKREPLFQRFAKNPNELHLAIEIKFIDDEIAECNRDIQLKKKADFASRLRSSR
jgi:hypothetical protein